MQFRIGINLGDVIQEEERIYGDGVNIAARLEGLAEAGGICISRTAYGQVKNKLELGYEYLGEHSVKNISEPVHVYRVLMDPEAAGKVIGEKRKEKRRMILAAVIILLISAGGLAGWYLYIEQSKQVEPASMEKMAYPLPDKPSIAVLPFDNMSEDPKQEYFSDGITEEIITALSKVQNLFVIARNSTFTYKDKPVKVQQVAEELGVRYVLEGSVRRAGDKVRITAQLIDATTGKHLWAERYDRELQDIFSVQDEITKKIVTALQVKLTEGEEARIYAKGTDNLDAYLKVMQLYAIIRDAKPEDIVLARQLAREAIALDPNWPLTYWALSWTYVFDVFFGLTKTPAKSLEQAYELGQKALALDENLGAAHYILSVTYTLKKQHEKAIEHGKQAVTLNPNGASFYGNLARLLMNSGRPEESIPLFKKAHRLNPFAGGSQYYNFGYALWMMGQYKEAIAAGKEARSRAPNDMFSHLLLAATYIELGRDEEARASAAEMLKIKPDTTLEWLAKMVPWKNKDDVDRLIGDLRKAGLK
jgi:adenylate cyclase